MDITISKNRYLQGKGVKTLQAVTQEWNEFIKDFEKPCLSNLSFYSYSSYLTEFYNLEDKERLSDNENDRRKELKGYIDSLKFHGGYYFGGTFESNTRGNAVTSKSLITLDIDNISPDIDFLDLVQNNSFLKPYEYIIHSTAKHFPKHQRYRLIIPLEEALTEDIALKYECIARHVANTIMDISKFDKTAFDDTHLMLYPIVAQNTPPKYYTYYHNETKNFLNSQEILSQYNYHDRYTFQGVERPAVPELPPTQKLYTSSSDLITSRDKDNLRVLIAQELQENNISVPDVTSTKKFGCVCGSSDACNFGRGYVCNCFSSNHDSRLGKRGNGVYTYDIFDLYAYTHNLDTSRDFIKICYELSRKYNITLENSEQVERFLYKPTAIDDFQDVGNNTTVAHHNGNGNNSTSSNAPELPPVPELPSWAYLSERGKICINEKNYCKYIANKLQIKTIKGRILTIDKELEETELENIVFSEISEYISQDLAPRTKKLVSAIKMFSFSQSLKIDSKIIHFLNGTYNAISKDFEDKKYWCINRLNVNYNPNASSPAKWLNYLNELLNKDDIITLQEYLGYCLIPNTKAQVMLFLIGSGGEGKSVIADILRALIGDNNINDDKIHELQNNRFKVANCENKLLNIDDDLDFKALSDTGLIKSVVTGASISVEQKGKQAYKIKPYCRLLAFGNGTLTSLYDHSDGFYRRQVIINTKPKRQDRIDNPFLADEIIENELEGILLWCLDGLHRLIEHGFNIYISQASKKAIENIKNEAFNFLDYLQNSDEVQFNENYEESSVDIYASYCNWCYNNALNPLKNRSVLAYLKDHADEYNIKSSEHIIKSGKRSRGFKGIRVAKYNQSAIC